MRTTTELAIYATAVLLVIGLLAATWWYAAQGEARQCYQVVDVDYFDEQWSMLVNQCTGDTWILTPAGGSTQYWRPLRKPLR